MVSNVRLCTLCIQESPIHSRVASINIGIGLQLNLKQNATRLVALVQIQEWNHIEMHMKKSEAYYCVDYR